MSVLVFAVIAQGAVICVLAWQLYRREAFMADLLDRLMARNYTEYALVKPGAPPAPRKRVLSDEDLAKREREMAAHG